jgi:2-polyprenyl-3-methyl-5-hydroxy-6-metoxy-1,4-benzoquinol methylase
VSSSDQARWDERHAQSQSTTAPAEFLREIVESAAWSVPRGQALDIACGKGRNAIYLAERGFDVTALDISAVALDAGRRLAQERNLKIDWRQCDLTAADLPIAAFDLIVSFNYLERTSIASIKQAVKPGGLVIFETYLIDQAAVGHPKNPDYLLKHNELLDDFRGFRVLLYREGKYAESGDLSFRAGIFARRIS